MKEADITISGQPLTTGQSMTVRVALEMFALDLRRDGLGTDEGGRALTRNYLDQIEGLMKLIHLTCE